MHLNLWIVVGFVGQVLFGSRFLIQWVYSERKKESYIPVIFWYLSLFGGLILLSYAIYKKDPVFVVGQSMGVVVYLRNLCLIYQHKNSRQSISAEQTTL